MSVLSAMFAALQPEMEPAEPKPNEGGSTTTVGSSGAAGAGGGSGAAGAGGGSGAPPPPALPGDTSPPPPMVRLPPRVPFQQPPERVIKCSTLACPYLVNSSESFGTFCCRKCAACLATSWAPAPPPTSPAW